MAFSEPDLDPGSVPPERCILCYFCRLAPMPSSLGNSTLGLPPLVMLSTGPTCTGHFSRLGQSMSSTSLYSEGLRDGNLSGPLRHNPRTKLELLGKTLKTAGYTIIKKPSFTLHKLPLGCHSILKENQTNPEKNEKCTQKWLGVI